MTAPHRVVQLVRTFGAQRAIYPAGVFTSARVRVEFIDPLFRALGWDVDNSRGLSPADREVVREGTVPAGGNRKAPDYSFRIDGRCKFFVEARNPSADIGAGPGAAFQLRRYARSAGLPVSIVTDFEEFALYDGQPEPKPDDDTAVARLMFLGFAELATEWEELESILSCRAVRDGSLEKHAQISRVTRGASEAGGVFLAEREQWRRCLAQDIAVRNTSLTYYRIYGLTDAERLVVQRSAEPHSGRARGPRRVAGA
jgi:hypothetical protein